MKNKRNKLAIVALGESATLAPWEDKSYDIWTMNAGCQAYRDKRIDLLFDMHIWQSADYVPYYYLFLKERRNEYSIVKPTADECLKNVIVFPRNEI